MWYARFLDAIDRSWIGDAIEKRLELIDKTDPQRIYVENIRSFFGVSFKVAKFLCDVAVREGVFEKRTGYICPNDQNIIGYVGEDDSEGLVSCYVCEALGRDEYEFQPRQLNTIEVYSLVSAPAPPATSPGVTVAV